jgi:hypothetical protein
MLLTPQVLLQLLPELLQHWPAAAVNSLLSTDFCRWGGFAWLLAVAAGAGNGCWRSFRRIV